MNEDSVPKHKKLQNAQNIFSTWQHMRTIDISASKQSINTLAGLLAFYCWYHLITLEAMKCTSNDFTINKFHP